ncbi:Uncharacterised protein [Bordetella pertussis]|nr:Uncharacterised protein [Bordetella pertussis]CFM51657.1 Uncharacterised protein [Bordetella pertussis]CFN27067.1 Uncharacterised protein [Bordetella pertussis]CFN71141.1 Uncharacterised protein [Bordetella pertussis]CFO09395.1 Uncharacterised protein [Bordetella pertussis]
MFTSESPSDAVSMAPGTSSTSMVASVSTTAASRGRAPSKRVSRMCSGARVTARMMDHSSMPMKGSATR